MANLTKEQSEKFITSKTIISEPGVYEVKCTNTHPFSKDLANGIRQVAIANFNCMSEYHRDAAVTLFSQGDYDEAANQGMSYSVLEGSFIPMKGQMVEVLVEEVTTSNGITGLFIQSVTGAPVKRPTKFSLSAFRSMTEGEPEDAIEMTATAFESEVKL